MDHLIHELLKGLTRAGYVASEPLAVAFSGGVDSTALLLLAHRALPEARLTALHVDHGARPGSAEDAAHCRRVAEALGVPFEATRLDAAEVEAATGRHGAEGGLRELRYRALLGACADLGIPQLALGHQADDAVESHVLAWARGSGLIGLAGPRAGTSRAGVRLLRPLLGVGREDLEELVRAWLPELGWREDPTNRELRFARNRVRHEVVPLLRGLAGGDAPLRRAMRNLRDDRAALEELLDRALAQLDADVTAPTLDLQRALDAEPPERVLVEAVRRWVAAQGAGRPPARGHVERLVAALYDRGRTRWLDLPGLPVRVADGRAQFDAAHLAEEAVVPARSVPLGVATRHGSLGVRVLAAVAPGGGEAPDDEREGVVFDADALGDLDEGLVLRGAREGDRFRPFGLGGTVRLRRWLADRGVPRAARPQVPVVTLDGAILWVVGHRRSDLAPVTAATRARLRIRVLPE